MDKLNKNDLYITKITGVNSEGFGVCRINSVVVFVPNSAVGDEIEVRIVKVLKSYCFGKIEKIITASISRQESECPVSQSCGGCVYRHINYLSETLIKQDRVKEAIARIGSYKDFVFEPIAAAEKRNHYRNKAQIPLGLNKDGELIMGYYGRHSHRIVNTKSCLLHPKDFDTVGEIFRNWFSKHTLSVYNEVTHKGLLRHLYLRKGENSNELMVCVVINGNDLPYSSSLIEELRNTLPNLKSFVININKEKTNVILGKECVTLWGSDFIIEKICGLDFKISPRSFFQVNTSQAEKLYKKALEFADLSGDEFILDLYCGTGSIGLSMAENSSKLIGVEVVNSSVDNANENAKINGIDAKFICGDATKAAQILASNNEKPDVVILDPPRKGCDNNLIDIVSKINPKKIVYISCDPSTLARDLKLFKEKSYVMTNAQAFDLFPCTSHVETVCLLSKLGVDLDI